MTWLKKIDFNRWIFANFIVLAAFGALLRFMICFPSGKLNYLNILHAHSHFAFAGWMFMALTIVIVSEVKVENSTAYRWILLLTLICSFGMLVSFSLEGYKAISIIFSTLFLVITYWFGYLVYRRYGKNKSVSAKLIKAGVGFMLISSIGPLALGFLKATGNIGIVYQNAIYFYLHFQMNGWMILAALGLIACKYLALIDTNRQTLRPWINAFILSTIPLFFIFTLWSRPALWVFVLAFIGASLNALSWFVIIKKLKSSVQSLPLLIKLALITISVKVVFQLFVCVPSIGEWTFLNRNLIIGYVHLITLACVTPVIISQFVQSQNFKAVDWSYAVLTVCYLVFLFIQPALSLLQIFIPSYQYYLLIISILYCFLGIIYYIRLFYSASNFFPRIKPFNQFLYESNN